MAGFVVDSIETIPRPTRLTGSPRQWLGMIAGPWLRGIAEPERSAILDEALVVIGAALHDHDGHWTADYVRLRFSAHVGTAG